MSITGLIVGALRRWKLSVTIILFCAVTSAVIALLMQPVYRAEAVVAPSNDSGGLQGLGGIASQLGGIAALAGLPFGRADNRAEAMGVLRSRLLIERLVNERQLMPILFSEKWDTAGKKWKTGAKTPTIGDALKIFEQRILSVREDLKSGLVIVRVEWTDRRLCAEWATAMVDMANDEMRRRTIEESTAALAVLQREYETAESVSLRTAISNVIETHMRARTLAEVRKQFAFRVVDPPVVPDPDKRVKPTRTLMVLIGGFLGGLLSLLLAAILDTRRRLLEASENRGSTPTQ
jgi:uncharacterized protein involved in exopolysaccharide biosynthesis